MTVWLCADTAYYPEGGGHRWVYLNWALGLRSLGCRVVWLEAVDTSKPREEIATGLAAVDATLRQYGLEGSLAVCSRSGEPLPPGLTANTVPLEEAREADLLLNMASDTCKPVLGLFRRTALLDIDPGLSQVLTSVGQWELPPHDAYFTVGETVGRPDSPVPDLGVAWQHTTPCVSLDWWPLEQSVNGARFTTVSHWVTRWQWVTYGDESYPNDKRAGFLPFIDLPGQTTQPLELALCLAADPDLRLAPHEEKERAELEQRGWHVVHAHAVAGTAWDYQDYIRGSLGEFSWVRPSCVRLQLAWISDRTPCYLASGKPAIVQHNGPSRFLPDGEGIFYFRDVGEAARQLEAVAADYDKHSAAARALAEELFDARKVVGSVLERALA